MVKLPRKKAKIPLWRNSFVDKTSKGRVNNKKQIRLKTLFTRKVCKIYLKFRKIF